MAPQGFTKFASARRLVAPVLQGLDGLPGNFVASLGNFTEWSNEIRRDASSFGGGYKPCQDLLILDADQPILDQAACLAANLIGRSLGHL